MINNNAFDVEKNCLNSMDETRSDKNIESINPLSLVEGVGCAWATQFLTRTSSQ